MSEQEQAAAAWEQRAHVHPIHQPDEEKIVWADGPPPPPLTDAIHDLSCQGIIGITLHQALLNVIKESTGAATIEKDGEDHKEENQDEEPASSQRALLDQQAVLRIVQSFGEAVVQSQHNECAALPAANQHKTDDSELSGNHEMTIAPTALLRGRLDHYNRLNGKWRFVVQGAQILPRKALDRNRRKRERPSLWQVASVEASTAAEPAVKIPHLEILAYNDIE